MVDLETVQKLMKCFPQSFITSEGEVVVDRKTNQYFRLIDCKDEFDIKCKVLEWLSRAACKSEPYGTKKKNDELHNFMLNGINKYLGTEFTQEDMYEIYTYLGNRCNHLKTREFVKSHYDMSIFMKGAER